MNKIQKFILFIVFIILIVVIFLYIYYIKNKYYICNPNKIAIIGNGPLSDKEINDINHNYDIIVVMNNGATGDKNNKLNATKLYNRQWGFNSNLNTVGINGFDSKNNIYHSYNKYSNTIKDIVIIAPEGEEYKKSIEYIKKNYNNVVLYLIKPNLQSNNETGVDFNFNKKNYKIYNKSISAGLLVIKHILDKYQEHDIHIYGMDLILQEKQKKVTME